jgi:hypothetical protein
MTRRPGTPWEEGKLTTQGPKCRYKMAPPGRTKREKNLFESRDSLPSIKYLARVLPLSSPFVTAWLFSPSSLSRPAFPAPAPRFVKANIPVILGKGPRRIGTQRVAHV